MSSLFPPPLSLPSPPLPLSPPPPPIPPPLSLSSPLSLPSPPLSSSSSSYFIPSVARKVQKRTQQKFKSKFYFKSLAVPKGNTYVIIISEVKGHLHHLTETSIEDELALSVRVGERSTWYSHEDSFVSLNSEFRNKIY